MKNKLIYPLIASVLLTGAACRGDRNAVSQQQYESVQEGSAAGVTSTIHGPGETIPPMTGTNSDTTTTFSLNPNTPPPATAQPGTIAGTLPAQPYPSTVPTGTYMPPAQPVTRPSQPITVTRSPQPVSQQPVNEPVQPVQPQPVQPQPEPQPPTETVEPVPPPPTQTDTTATQPPPPAPKKEKPPAKQQEEEEEEQTDTAEPPPPPPPVS